MQRWQLKDEESPWTKLGVRTIYDNPWIHVEEHEVLDPKGNPSIYGVVHTKNLAIGILPLDEDYNTYLVGQFRFPLDRYSWEIVEGGGKPGISPIESGKRELKEETGLEAKEWIEIMTIHTSNCIADETAILFVAKGLTQGAAEPDDNEKLQVAKLPFSEVYQMVLEGRITDSMSVCTILRAHTLIQEGKL
ncbi:MAG: NUDIX hydrolase [Chitinophagales bacterium]|nr:NUDIX hydrolase [Chitinophagales bacterium]